MSQAMGKLNLSTSEGPLKQILKTWSSIRSDVMNNHLYFSTSDGQSILFNREIVCFLSPLLSDLIKGTCACEGSCCLTNYENTISLPDVNSKTVYDLQSLMINGTVNGMSSEAAEELKSLHNVLGFKSPIVKEETADELIVDYEYRIEDDRTEIAGGCDDGNEGEEANDRNDGAGGYGPIPTNSEEINGDVDMSDLEIDNTTDGTNKTNDHEEGEVDEDISSTENNGKTTLDVNAKNDKRGGKITDDDDDADMNVQQDFNPADVNIRNSHEENLDPTQSSGDNDDDEEELQPGDYKKLKMNCNVKLAKLKKDENTRRKKRVNYAESDDTDFDASLHVKNVRPRRNGEITNPDDFLNKHVTPDAQDGRISYICGICKRFRYRKRYQVRVHVEAMHFPGAFIYPCGICGKELKSKRDLCNHNRIHK